MTAGPSVVCVGGGHGLAATLRAVVPWAGAVTAVVSVADDGGSSGRLRHELGVLPPGDLRRCLGALADPASVLGRALEYRFPDGDLKEHALGNLLIAGLVGEGSTIEEALDEVGRLVGARGRVLPAATVPVTLTGELDEGGHGDGGGHGPASISGQVRVQGTAGLRRVGVRPADPPTPPTVAEALADADLVVLGPGSLFTSVLAAAVVPGVAAALRATPAQRVLVVNLGPQMGETEELGPDDHVRLAREHGVPVDVVLADPRFAPGAGPEVVVRPLGVEDRPVHDPVRLGEALRDLARPRA
ncbi:MAG TPA: uridine diphosphate-N-acetylglucosamine-binding protein YvcK [Acidimicrobiales bacterium]|nr:uridine diphosphate-N-acetylglucosamine-binding protein YvcK [Acidimicrobiales bacterium]